ncbi:MAG: hypothetical protein WAU62_02935, partial [Dehalococcoidales bacterium]
MKNRLPRKIRWSLGIFSVLIGLSLIAASCTAAVTSTSTTTTTTPTSTLTTTTTTPTTTMTTTTTGLLVTTPPPTTTTNPAAMTVLTVVNGNTSQNYTLAQLQALETTDGYGTTKSGAIITGPNNYVGVKFTTLLKASGGMTNSEALTITAQNGSTEDLSYAQIYQGTVNT